MKKLVIILSLLVHFAANAQNEKLIYHEIKTDAAGRIIPWYSADLGDAYHCAIMSVWHFWDTIRVDMNGLPYYMNHQVWIPGVNDTRGIGGDQIQMALSSWRLLYQYSGDGKIRENMKFLAEYYLTHGLSAPADAWPAIPYPYNTLVYSGRYDGDMVIGKNFTQPDKAGSFGFELVNIFKMIGNQFNSQVPAELYTNFYLEAAVKIANTLAGKIKPGDYENSPLPFKVNAVTGEIGKLFNHQTDGGKTQLSSYTTNWSGTLELFLELIKLKKGNITAYKRSVDILLAWMKKYPLQNNRWGPFFEDIPGWSDTQINAVTFAQFMMNHPEYFPEWKQQVKQIFNWVYKTLGNKTWEKYGVTVINEQTAYQTPGNSHTARQASAELQYSKLTKDTSYIENAIRELNWATYMVDTDGKNRYPQDENWLTDGYGDYVRHYLRSFAVMPELAPSNEDHILSSTTVIEIAEYRHSPYKRHWFEFMPSDNVRLRYNTFDNAGEEMIRMSSKPAKVFFNGQLVEEQNSPGNGQGYTWKAMQRGGLLMVRRVNAKDVVVE